MSYNCYDCYLCTGCRGTWLCERHRIASSERALQILEECERRAEQRAREDEELARALVPGDTVPDLASTTVREGVTRGACEGADDGEARP